MEKQGYRIVKGLPIPGESRVGKRKYPFVEMDMGDCLKFEASSRFDSNYIKIYSSAVYYSKRRGADYTFTFAKIDDRHYGCWKVAKGRRGEPSPEGSGRRVSQPKTKRVRRKKSQIESIPVEVLKAAWHSEGTIAGAARRVGLHPSTYERIISRIINTK